jgi:dTDP-4-dehydrorhamnose 3,5-epimerase
VPADFPVIRAKIQQLLHRQPTSRIRKLRRQFHQRNENEPPFSIARVRYDEVGLIENPILIEEDVDIDRSGPLGLIPHSSGLSLDLQAALQERRRLKQRPYLEHRIQKPRLLLEIPRFRRIERCASTHGDVSPFQRLHRSAQLCFSIADIRTKAEVNLHRMHYHASPNMNVRVTPTPLESLVLIDIDFFKDERGFFIESWTKRDFAAAGVSAEFVQDSHSASRYGVLRGMHYQDMRAPMGKLVRCTVGRILDVAIDLRVSSPTFGKWFAVELNAENKSLLYVPVGFAHGFATLSEYCEVQYKQTEYYKPETEAGIAWNDPDVGIQWPYDNPVLSKRDQAQTSLKDYRKKPAFE